MDRLQRVRLGYFSPSIISAVAQRHGCYRAVGLEVEELAVRSSPQQFESLRQGEYDLVLTAPDNVAAYRFNDDNPLQEPLDVRIVAGVDAGTRLSLVSGPRITAIADLRDRRVAVDVPTSGFALVLYLMLERAGLQAGRDVELVTAGSTPRRWAALRDGEFDATLLNAGFDVLAEASGYLRLTEVGEVVDDYLGTVVAAMGRTLHERTGLVDAFLHAWAQARRHVLDPANRAEVTDLVSDQLSMSSIAAERVTDVLMDPRTGLVRDGRVPRKALASVLELRSIQGGFNPRRVVSDLLDPRSGLVDDRLDGST